MSYCAQRMEKMTKQLAQKSEDPEAGAFIGFESSESDMSQDEVQHDMTENCSQFLSATKLNVYISCRVETTFYIRRIY